MSRSTRKSIEEPAHRSRDGGSEPRCRMPRERLPAPRLFECKLEIERQPDVRETPENHVHLARRQGPLRIAKPESKQLQSFRRRHRQDLDEVRRWNSFRERRDA